MLRSGTLEIAGLKSPLISKEDNSASCSLKQICINYFRLEERSFPKAPFRYFLSWGILFPVN